MKPKQPEVREAAVPFRQEVMEGGEPEVKKEAVMVRQEGMEGGDQHALRDPCMILACASGPRSTCLA